MGKFSPQAQAPAYMQDFRCIGPECEEHCCSGWQVTIDKRTYKKYLAVTKVPLKELLHKSMIRKAGGGFADHAVIKLNPDRSCPMLTNEKLCVIQSELGADFLSHTCNHYPRQYSRRDGDIWLYATLSCPQAARLALLDPRAMDIHSMALALPNESALPSHPKYESQHAGATPLARLAPAILSVTRQIIATPWLKAWESMIIIGFMMRAVARELTNELSDDTSLSRVLFNFSQESTLAEFRDGIQGIEPNGRLQMTLLAEMTTVYTNSFLARPSFAKVLQDALEGLEFDGSDLPASETRYRKVESEWFQPFDDAHPHILKNYLLNDVGKNHFPLGKDSAVEQVFIELAARFALLRLYLTGIAGLKKETFGEADYVRVIYSFVRNIEHNGHFMPTITGLMKKQELNNFATAAILLR